jgi:hypothetical protein
VRIDGDDMVVSYGDRMEQEQQIFVASFYGFLKYDPKNDYVIDLDDVWKWIGFSTKQKAKMLLEDNFVKDKEYILLNPQVKQKKRDEVVIIK